MNPNDRTEQRDLPAHWTGQGTIAADARPGTAAHQWLTIVVAVCVLFGLAGFFAASGLFMPY